MKLLPALRRNGRHSLAALALFLCASHAWTVASLVTRSKREVSAVADQSAANVEAALRAGDLIALRNEVGRLRVDGVTSLEFTGPSDGTLSRFAQFTVGSSRRKGAGVLTNTLDLALNGASLGRVDYEIDLFAVNRKAIGGNGVLYVAAVLFMAFTTVLANLGTIRVLSKVESVLGGLAGRGTPTQAQELSAVLEQGARDAASDPVLRSLFSLLAQYSQQIEAARKAEADMAVAREIEALAAMVAHDIRAPLAALETAIGGGAAGGTEQALARAAVTRISAIADDVLARARSGTGVPNRRGSLPAASSPEPLDGILSAVVDELSARPTTGRRLRADPARTGGLFVHVEPKAFFRVLSNVCHNALEAVGTDGTVSVGTEAEGRMVVVTVTDDGPGIPADVLPKLGRRGATFGKEGGNGLGLWHAKTTVESWGGRLEIRSEVGRGTTVRLVLPRADAPTAPCAGPADAVLIDDDPLVRMNWTVAAKRAGASLSAYPDVPSFVKEADGLGRTTPVYIDSDLGGGVKGEEAARDLAARGFTELHLATGHDPASFPPLPHLKSVRGKEPPWPEA